MGEVDDLLLGVTEIAIAVAELVANVVGGSFDFASPPLFGVGDSCEDLFGRLGNGNLGALALH